MSNSSLATVQIPAYSGNYTKGRESTIQEITIHHMAGRLTAQRCGELFQAVGRQGSSHYGIGYDGVIGQYVDEANTAWTNSNRAANHRAVTIETANDSTGGNWPVNDVTLRSLINLVADIAIRNNLVPLVKGKNLTWHQMYSATACPGPDLLSKMDYIVEEANKIINGGADVTRTPVTITYQVYDGAWLGNITGYNVNDSKYGYAGGTSKSISGVYANASVGNVYYRVHQKGGEWLPEVKNREDYAGNLGYPIDGFMIRSDATQLHYRAHDKTHGWLSEISGYDMYDANTGYAGWTGYEIDAIMIRADDIVTIVEKPKVEEPAVEPKKQLYRIRLTWADAKSQVGAYSNLENAKKVCPEGYGIYDEEGNEVYRRAAVDPAPETPKQEEPSEIPTPNPAPEVSGDTPETKVYDLNYPSKVIIVNEKPIEYDENAMSKVIKGITNNNSNFDIEIAKAFFKLAIKYRIDPVMVLAQSILETGWFKYNGSAVKPEQHNYCGLGVTSNGLTGGSFDTIEEGITAQLQHLFAYGSKDALPEGEEILDPRFKYVTRGIAPTWQQLAGRWAVPGYHSGTYDSPLAAMNAGNTYGQRIEKIAKELLETEINDEDVKKYFPKEESSFDHSEFFNPTRDYNGDGVIDKKDGEYLLYHINFPEDYPLMDKKEPAVDAPPVEKPDQTEPEPTPVEPTTPTTATSFWKEILEILLDFIKSLFTK